MRTWLLNAITKLVLSGKVESQPQQPASGPCVSRPGAAQAGGVQVRTPPPPPHPLGCYPLYVKDQGSFLLHPNASSLMQDLCAVKSAIEQCYRFLFSHVASVKSLRYFSKTHVN
ncbi:unnamed protein product [Pleuronectes platessa]|uniref:Uncharacterized protein n=1 Tax=Pleuronectes platessa TaxID=8262 RepID=A0A9N7ZDN8_PLEPL|nr:unnamed protein product [Pleuronectes platessa]